MFAKSKNNPMHNLFRMSIPTITKSGEKVQFLLIVFHNKCAICYFNS